jgi:hypothetical protein
VVNLIRTAVFPSPSLGGSSVETKLLQSVTSPAAMQFCWWRSHALRSSRGERPSADSNAGDSFKSTRSLWLRGRDQSDSFARSGHIVVEFGSLIAAVGEQLFQKRKHPKQGRRHDENAAIAILNIAAGWTMA